MEEGEGAKGSEIGENGDDNDVNLAEGTTVPLVIRERRTGKRSLVGTYHVASMIANSSSSSSQPTSTVQQQSSLGFQEANAYLAEARRPGLSKP